MNILDCFEKGVSPIVFCFQNYCPILVYRARFTIVRTYKCPKLLPDFIGQISLLQEQDL